MPAGGTRSGVSGTQMLEEIPSLPMLSAALTRALPPALMALRMDRRSWGR